MRPGALAPILALGWLAAAANPAPASENASLPCVAHSHEGRAYTVCAAHAGQDDIRLWHTAPDGMVYGSFDRIEATLAESDESLAFAMNAGMYHPDRAPVGLYVEDGVEAMRLITARGPGNFGMLPNGVFCVAPSGFAVIESRSFAETAPACDHATQSGPMLVIDGELHPRFIADSTSRLMRNGVGVSADGRTAYFAITEQGVNFHEFAQFFREALDTPNALYFDGNVSRLHAPALGRSDGGRQMGPVVGLVQPAAR
ncbi:phosphodiester glycosidase family protein [Alkalilacustris brevis]|uniref:phosphodiester glycosidase family protein n=1 Tax=Alkalilacustris brevis TaxID=2026338 RepID=UPI000E0D9B01|nr:phosphodiester glycosidase family protein [Alkalilacustris brevis]